MRINRDRAALISFGVLVGLVATIKVVAAVLEVML
jgi:hypothetical protein